jgi:predicted SnoaL-like aldol condensation-catalyzing enzyme
VDWAYTIWDGLVENLHHPDNHHRAIAAQILCNLAKSNPDARILKDFAALLAVTRDERFVTARHCLQALWKVGAAGQKQKQKLVVGLELRFKECLKEAAVTFLELASSGTVREAYTQFVGAGFRHHNPFFEGSAQALQAGMEERARQNPGKVLVVKQAIAEGDWVVVHAHARQTPADLGAAVVHLFRFEAGRIVELWDVGQLIPEKSLNSNGMV